MASAGTQTYWCYRCSRSVHPAGSGDIVCPDCGDGFLEEIESPEAPAPPVAGFPPWNFTDYGPVPMVLDAEGFYPLQPVVVQRPRTAAGTGNNPAIAQILETVSSFFQHMHTTQYAAGDETAAGPRPAMDSGPVDPELLFRGQMQNLFGAGNVEVYFDTGNGAGPRRLAGNIGDYFFGPGLDQLIQHLAENDPNRFGTPPASKSAVEAMPTITIAVEHLGTDTAHCAVCKDEFELGMQVKQMPCKHIYHADCILPWLEQHSSCPVCRYEMPTDDPDYDQSRRQQAVSEGGGGERGGAGNGGVTIFGLPGALTGGLASGGGQGRNNASSRQEERPNGAAGTSNVSQGGNTGPTVAAGGGRRGGGRLFSITLPWQFRPTTTSQSPANAQAERSSQATSTETVSSRPSGESNEAAGQASHTRRTDDDGDTLMSETRQEDLD